MSGIEGANEVPVEEASFKLSQGLKSCRTVVENYRSLLTSSDPLEAKEQQELEEAALSQQR